MATHSIDIPGLLRNSLSVGVSIPDALSELIDNSLSAGSTEVRLNLTKEGVLIASDNGHGMDQDKLEQSCCLHSRTTSSSKHHGRYGFGSKQADIILTNLEGPVTKFSSVDGNGISQITVNYPKILHTGVYYPQGGGIQRDSQHIWEQNAIKPHGSGTISCITLSPAIQCALSELIMNRTVSGLRFKFATTYREALTQGVKICIQIGDIQYQLHPIDRLCSSLRDASVHFKHETHAIVILQNAGETVAHVISEDGSRRQFDQIKKTWMHVDAVSADSNEIGRVEYELAYSPDWNQVQKIELEQNDITPLNKGQTGVGAQRLKTNGKELVRNGKIIKHIETKYKNVQNAVKEIYHETRERMTFDATEQMDEVFNVQVNKSHVNEDLIHPNVWKTFERIRQTFVSECHKIFEQLSASVASTSVSPSVSVSPSLSLSVSVERRLSHAKSASTSTSKAKSNSKPESRLPSPPQSDSESGSDNEGGAAGGGAAGGGAAGGGAAAQAAMEEAMEEGGVVLDVDVAMFVPDLESEVVSSKRQGVRRRTGENILAEWKRSGQYMATFDETLDKMHIEFSGKIAADTLKRYLKCIPLEKKYELLLELIREKYPLPEDRMKGIELLRIYRDAFGADALVDL